MRAELLLGTMVYGPIVVFLVELFPTRIRSTSSRRREEAWCAPGAGTWPWR